MSPLSFSPLFTNTTHCPVAFTICGEGEGKLYANLIVAYSRLDVLLLLLLLHYCYCKYYCCFFKYETCRPELQRKTLNFVDGHIIL